jgi:hypothetical protein
MKRDTGRLDHLMYLKCGKAGPVFLADQGVAPEICPVCRRTDLPGSGAGYPGKVLQPRPAGRTKQKRPAGGDNGQPASEHGQAEEIIHHTHACKPLSS